MVNQPYPYQPAPQYRAPYTPPYAVRPVIPQDPKKVYSKSVRRDSNRLSWMVLAGIFGMSFLYLFLSIGLRIFGYPLNLGQFDGMSEEVYFALSCLYYVVGMFLPFLLMTLVSKMSANELIPVNRVGFFYGLLCVLLGAGICLVANYPSNLVSYILEEIGLSGELPETPLPQGTAGSVLYFVNIAIIPPFVEEFAFRGVILSRLRKYGNGFAVFASSILFALFHGNLIQFVFAFICGMIFAYIVIKTGNIFLTILLHAINNGFSVITELWYQASPTDQTDLIQTIIFFAIIGLGIIALVLMIIRHREFFKKTPGAVSPPYSFGRRFAMFLLNPGFIALFAYFVFSTIEFLTM